MAAWDLQGTPLDESDLSLELKEGSTVTVDGLAMAQFMHLILRNASLTNAINALQSKVVLILGRFTPRRKAILDAVRAELASSRLGYVPVIFDFAKPAQTVLETVTLLARMSRFVIADLTSAKSVLQELQAIVPLNPSLPVQPIIFGTGKEPGMVDFFRKYPWYLPLARYRSSEDLIDKLRRSIVRQLEQAAVGARK